MMAAKLIFSFDLGERCADRAEKLRDPVPERVECAQAAVEEHRQRHDRLGAAQGAADAMRKRDRLVGAVVDVLRDHCAVGQTVALIGAGGIGSVADLARAETTGASAWLVASAHRAGRLPATQGLGLASAWH